MRIAPWLLALLPLAAQAAEPVRFSGDELRTILRHGPWPPKAPPGDPSNRASGQPAAQAYGRALFFDAGLSPSGKVSCASCHVAEKDWTDGRPRGVGLAEVDRNTPSLWNTGWQRWLGWDGASDNLWSQSIKPLLHPLEMGASVAHLARHIRQDPALACLQRAAFGAAPAEDEALVVDAGKAIAAFVQTIVSGRTPFDRFRDRLARGDGPGDYPAAAQRGLKLFVGRGNCSFCHFGPHFTNGEFHDIGVRHMIAPGRVDAGRFQGIRALLADRYNLLGRFSDDASGASAVKTRHVEAQHRNFGEFKVPTLRNVARTAPYMHDGQLATLHDVVNHYSTVNEERLHGDGERLVRPLKLSPQESDDLVAFLASLSDPAPRLPQPGWRGCDEARR